MSRQRRFPSLRVAAPRFRALLAGGHDIADEDQLFPRPGQRHIKDAQFLRPRFVPDDLLHSAPGDGRVPPCQRSLRFRAIHADSQIFMNQNLFLLVLGIQLFRQIGQHDDGKFQPFALVHGHDADYVLFFPQRSRHGKVGVPVFHLPDEFQEAEKPAKIRLLIVGRPVDQHAEIGLPHESAGLGADVIVIPRVPVKLPQKLGNADMTR